jgi:hypothetical protein
MPKNISGNVKLFGEKAMGDFRSIKKVLCIKVMQSFNHIELGNFLRKLKQFLFQLWFD